MDITLTKQVSETVTLQEQDVLKVVRKFLFEKLEGQDVEMFEGELCVTRWEKTHGSGITHKVRVATEQDKAVYLILSNL